MHPIKQYFQHDRAEMLVFIPPSASCTLEVGCGAGSFSVLIKEKWAVCRTYSEKGMLTIAAYLGKAS